MGFPYGTQLYGDGVSRHMLANASWHAFHVHTIGGAPNLICVDLNVQSIHLLDEAIPGEARTQRLEIEGSDGRTTEAQLAVVAIGFDPWWFWPHLDLGEGHTLQLEQAKEDWPTAIGTDLAVPLHATTGRLHLPMLAGTAQGRDFPIFTASAC